VVWKKTEKNHFQLSIEMIKVKKGQIIHVNMYAGDCFLAHSIPKLSIYQKAPILRPFLSNETGKE
jgi:hypothetical protein